MKKVIVYSHGFGVKQDARGLFTEITENLPNFEHVMFDYNTYRDGMLTVTPLEFQVNLLKKKLEEVHKSYPKSKINLVCHSQGCVIAGLLQPKVDKILLLTPPEVFNEKLLSNIFKTRKDVRINEINDYFIPRSDGSTSLVPHEYWQSLSGFKESPSDLYRKLASNSKVMIIKADHDEILGPTDLTSLDDVINVISLDTDHDLTDMARMNVIKLTREFFNES